MGRASSRARCGVAIRRAVSGDMIASAARAWRTEGASAFLALIGINLHHAGRRVMKDRSDGNHWHAAVVAHRRWKLEDEVTKRIDGHFR